MAALGLWTNTLMNTQQFAQLVLNTWLLCKHPPHFPPACAPVVMNHLQEWTFLSVLVVSNGSMKMALQIQIGGPGPWTEIMGR